MGCGASKDNNAKVAVDMPMSEVPKEHKQQEETSTQQEATTKNNAELTKQQSSKSAKSIGTNTQKESDEATTQTSPVRAPSGVETASQTNGVGGAETAGVETASQTDGVGPAGDEPGELDRQKAVSAPLIVGFNHDGEELPHEKLVYQGDEAEPEFKGVAVEQEGTTNNGTSETQVPTDETTPAVADQTEESSNLQQPEAGDDGPSESQSFQEIWDSVGDVRGQNTAAEDNTNNESNNVEGQE